jgi:exosortase/archaeosortase family protein
MRGQQGSRRWSPGLRFGLAFFGWLLVLSGMFWAGDVHRRLLPLQEFIARASTALEHLIGGSAAVDGVNIVLSGLMIEINHECTGVFVAMLFVAFVLAYPVSWRARLGALVIGLPGLLVVNLLRLATLARVAEAYPQTFAYFHEYVWQGVLMVVVLVGSVGWAERYG